MKTISIDFQGRPLSIESGRLAKQANGSVFLRYGDTIVLVTAVAGNAAKKGNDFLPLSVDYFERFSSAGRIPGGFFKREGKQSERETLVSRLTDRPIRPLFPDNYICETQIISTVLSYDNENDPDVLSILGASAALQVSDIPFLGPVAAVRVGRIKGEWICNPRISDYQNSDIDMIVAATRDAIVMVEGGAQEVAEKDVLEGLKFGFQAVQPLLDIQDELQKQIGKSKISLVEMMNENDASLQEEIRANSYSKLTEALKIPEKLARYRLLTELKNECMAFLGKEDSFSEEKKDRAAVLFDQMVASEIRNKIVSTKKRVDQRSNDEIRPISVEIGLLPRSHGSALFTRGETQAMVTATLGTADDEQRIDSLAGESRSRFMLHYNFPPFSVGEVKSLRGPARREIGHGALAQKAIRNVLPEGVEFPYTIRVVSDILESHGSSSMATVCGTTLALMDAGVPIKSPVAGIAMGLIKEGNNILVLSDISGDEDHIGDMDFKVAGTKNGVTALQMDIKVRGISWDVLEKALHQAYEGRCFILGKMMSAIENPREKLSEFAPRIETMQISTDKIREVIGPGGKMIRSIIEQSQAKIDIQDSGIVTIASPDLESLSKARAIIEGIVAEPEVGKTYKGKVQRIMEYGAFVEILPGKDGLLHISQIQADERVRNVEDYLHEGDEIEVRILEIDYQGKIKLSQREQSFEESDEGSSSENDQKESSRNRKSNHQNSSHNSSRRNQRR